MEMFVGFAPRVVAAGYQSRPSVWRIVASKSSSFIDVRTCRTRFASSPTGQRSFCSLPSTASAIVCATTSGPGTSSPPLPAGPPAPSPRSGRARRTAARRSRTPCGCRRSSCRIRRARRARRGRSSARPRSAAPRTAPRARTWRPSRSRPSGADTRPAIDETFTITPLSRSRICGAKAWIIRTTPKTFVSMTLTERVDRSLLDGRVDADARVVHEDVDLPDRVAAGPRPTRRR